MKGQAPIQETRGRGAVAAVWGLVGILALLFRATWSLGGRGVITIRAGLEGWEMGVLVALTAFFLVTEGYAGFQKRWVPKVVARLVELRRRPAPLHAALAPLYGMMLIGAQRRIVVRAWIGVVAIVAVVLVVRAFPEPWRGIVDLAVAAALAWGSAALAVQGVRALRT